MTTRIGILSDTHLIRPDEYFRQLVDLCFADVPIIFHAGDLTDLSVLDAFGGREVHAVHGNMCHVSSRNNLPAKKIIYVEGFAVGLMHGMGFHHHMEEHLLREFDKVDCIVFGHTHRPVCHALFEILFINPGTFIGSGRHGAPGTYAILEADKTLTGQILEVPRLR
ncbi:MAG: YfcE family phosphodiesterase [Deltaproteobacteria bacterium]|nr:YfcE family phosphodiesterase [Deltaproteobacteria bacterium]